MGVGYVPPSQVSAKSSRPEFSRCQYRGNRTKRPDLAEYAPHRPGERGEIIATEFLVRRGARLLSQNLRIGAGELDIVMSATGRKAAVEVKSGSGTADPMVHFDEDK